MGMFSSLFNKRPTADFRQLVGDGALIIDVRSRDEFNSGHVRNSINIPLDSIEAELPGLKHRNKTIITCCRSGSRSAMAQSILAKAGIVAYNGGAWQDLEQQL